MVNPAVSAIASQTFRGRIHLGESASMRRSDLERLGG